MLGALLYEVRMSRRLQMLQWTMMIVLWGGIVVRFFGPDRLEDLGLDISIAAMLAFTWLNAYANYPRHRWLVYLAAIATFFVASAWLIRLFG